MSNELKIGEDIRLEKDQAGIIINSDGTIDLYLPSQGDDENAGYGSILAVAIARSLEDGEYWVRQIDELHEAAEELEDEDLECCGSEDCKCKEAKDDTVPGQD